MEWAWFTAQTSIPASKPMKENTPAVCGPKGVPAKAAGNRRSGRSSSTSSAKTPKSSSHTGSSKPRKPRQKATPTKPPVQPRQKATPTKPPVQPVSQTPTLPTASKSLATASPKAPPTEQVSAVPSSSQSTAPIAVVNTMASLPACSAGPSSLTNPPESPEITQFRIADNSPAVSLAGTVNSQSFSLGPPILVAPDASGAPAQSSLQGLLVNQPGSLAPPNFVILRTPLPTMASQEPTQLPPTFQPPASDVPGSSQVVLQDQPLTQESTEPQRGRSRSRSDSKGRRRRRRRSSSSYSSDSPNSPRRKRHHHSGDSQLLGQILGMLSTLPQFAQTTAQAPDRDLIHSPSTSGVSHDLPLETQEPSEGTLDSETEVQPLVLEEQVSHQDFSDDYVSEDEEQPLYGTDIPRDAFEKAVEVLRRQLGFPAETPSDVPSSSKSKLTLNTPVATSSSALPVDAECADRFRALPSGGSGRRWTAFSKTQNVSFRVEDKDWRDLFKTPGVPQGADDYLRSVGAFTSGSKLRSPAARKALRSLHLLDTASRVGMKFSSSLLLIAEVLTKALRQSTQAEVSKKDTAILVNLLGPLARRIFDQFARVSVKTVVDRRDIILEAMRLSQENVKRRFRDLPILGQDIFSGQFETVLQEEAKRKKDLLKANLSGSRSFSGRPSSRRSPPRGRPSRPSARGRQSYSSGSRPSVRPAPPSRSRPVSTAQPRPRYRPARSQPSRGRGFSRP